jgi:opacity protein-like surface antigen
MKKLSLLFGVVFVLGSFASASAIDQTGKFAVGGHLGYSFGFGDAFKKYERSYESPLTGFEEFKYQNKVTYCFWGNIKYGLNPNLALMGIVDYQAGDVEVTGSVGEVSGSISDSYHWTSVLGNLLFNLSPENNTCPYFTGGGGIYMNDNVTKPGINLGAGIEHFLQENLALDIGTRLHWIFTEDQNTNYLNIYAGINYYLGAE